MKKALLSLAVITLFSFTRIQQNWKAVSLLDKVQVSLPANATEDKTKGIAMQKAVLADSTELNAFALDYATFGMTEQMLQQMAGTDEFKQQMEAGIASQPNVKLIKNEQGKLSNKYFYYDVTLEVDSNGKKKTVKQRMVFYKQYGLTLIYKPGKNAEDPVLRDKFFTSLKIAE
jgi:hypothetical protein